MTFFSCKFSLFPSAFLLNYSQNMLFLLFILFSSLLFHLASGPKGAKQFVHKYLEWHILQNSHSQVKKIIVSQ